MKQWGYQKKAVTMKSRSYKLPKYCHVKNKKSGLVVYRPRVKSESGLDFDKNGFLRPPITLGYLSDGEEELYKKYLIAVESLNTLDARSLYSYADKFFKSERFIQFTPKSQSNYLTAKSVLKHPIQVNGKPAELGDLNIAKLNRPLLNNLRDRRLTSYRERGLHGGAMVNFELKLLSNIVSWAINYDELSGVVANPVIGLSKCKEGTQDRLVTDKEYQTQLEIATGYLPEFFEATYLTAARKMEIRELKKKNITDEGIEIERRKGSKKNIIAWTPRLRAAIDTALSKSPAKSPYVFTDRNGSMISDEGIKSAMSRLKKKMKDQGLEEVYWSMHLLKHKGVTDSENKEIAGHKNPRMKALYDKSIPVIGAVK